MAFKKGPAQAQKSGPKSASQAGKKAPPTKKPLAASLDDDDDDLDEEDDDFSMDEDSDLSGADEDLDNEELDDEELDDEGLDDEELDDEELDEESKDEDVPAPKATKQESAATKAQGQQQKSPVKQSPQTPKEKVPVVAAVNGKRTAEFDAGSSPAKKIRLEDHIPAFFVLDYKERDLRDVMLTSFTDGVTKDDIKKLCKNAQRALSFSPTHWIYGGCLKRQCQEEMQQSREHLHHREDEDDEHSRASDDSVYLNKNKLAALFPTGEVLKVQKDGYAQHNTPLDSYFKCISASTKNIQFFIQRHVLPFGTYDNKNSVVYAKIVRLSGA
ncbi:uncharacterized protein LOC125757237 [Rhipicephalus sanguineus]|uniref:uncharacterized protein LOC125757237 n=1 Tax=Rhipicephalus sanguineus TaxID=34632 RepID=UPI0020C32EDE|nr:uncharacterized protein LOC125757237 [Rhipicephalus sanguineus]